MLHKRIIINVGAIAVVAVILGIAIWGPEQIAKHRDKKILNKITLEQLKGVNQGYR